MNNRLKTVFNRLLSYEQCAHKLSLSFCMGIYIAFSPFVGFHTAMAFLFSWLFALNCAIMLSVSMAINNPWTMMPVYGAGYAFGDWFLRCFGIDHTYNPAWIYSSIQWLSYYTGFSKMSFWGFLLGGNVIGVLLGMICYPLVRRYAGLIQQGKTKIHHTFIAARKVVSNAKPILSHMTKSKKQIELQ